MAGTLFIRFERDGVAWRSVGPRAGAGRGALAEAAGQVQGRRVVVLVPAADCLLLRTEMPTRNRERILRAAPYALEERLAGDPEDLHFALGSREAGNAATFAVVSHAVMEDWLARLSEAGITPAALVPDITALPASSEAWTLVREPGGALLATGGQRGLALDPDNLTLGLQLALDEAEEPPQRLAVLECDPDTPPLPPLEVTVDQVACGEGVLHHLAAAFPGANPIDLLQGPYSRSEQLGRLWRPWRAAAVLAGLWIVTHLVALGLQNRELAAQELALRGHITEVYLDTFPDARKVVDPRLQMERRLSALRSGQSGGEQGFLEILARAGAPLSRTEDLTIRNLRYRNGRVDVDLTVANLQMLDALKQSLEGERLSVEIRSARASGDQVEGRLEIREGHA
jgi:general secretion pathway protein L